MKNKKFNIIVVDDDQHILKGFEIWFDKKLPNINVKTCTEFSAKCLCDDMSIRCQIGGFDAIILDYYLSSSTIAPDIIKNIRDHNKDVLIVVMSSAFVTRHGEVTCINRETMKSALNCGANRVVPKNIEDVIDVVMTHLKVRHESNTKLA